MKASYRWIKSLVPQLTASPEELAARITAAGLEVEGMQRFGVGGEACVMAKVVSVRAHPTKSGLRLVTVVRGGDNVPQEVVCGAPNVPEPEGLVVLAPLGTHLPAKNMTIEKRAIGGIVSEGMLCSEQELGLSEEGDGIMVFAPGLFPAGTPFMSAVPSAEDTIFEIGLNPNRPDCLGHLGLAREVAALYGFPWSMPKVDAPARMAASDVAKLATVVVEDAERCPHYAATAVEGVTIGPSPTWLRHRLASLGVRPISNVVDITNLVLLEYGHPMHAFDLDRVRGAKIVVRRAREGERLKTLDGIERTLVADDLVICDGEGPVALAGVMGGATSEIHAGTTRVLFECAYFEPRGVRRSSRRQGLHTESSHRFERGVDPGDVSDALARATSATTTLAGGAAATGAVHVTGKPIERATVTLRSARIDALLGVAVPFAEATAILKLLGFEAKNEKSDPPSGVSATRYASGFVVPTWRPDIAREVDLIEEVARVRGLDKIPAVLPKIHPTREIGGKEELARLARAAAVELGLLEAITYAFVSPAQLEAVSAPASTMVIKNPLSELQSVMRTSLLPGLLEALSRARRHGQRDLTMFTIGPIFLPSATKDGLPDEQMAFAAVLAGDRSSHLSKAQPIDVWDAKGLATGLIARLARRDARVTRLADAERPRHLHPRGAAGIYVQNTRVGTMGPLHPDVVSTLDLGDGAQIVELDLRALGALGTAAPQYAAIPRFPASTRDIALVVHDDVLAGEVERVVRDAAGPLAEDVRIFDRFVGGSIPAQHASLAFRVVYRAPDRTLTDAEVDTQHVKVVAEVGAKFGATLRS